MTRIAGVGVMLIYGAFNAPSGGLVLTVAGYLVGSRRTHGPLR